MISHQPVKFGCIGIVVICQVMSQDHVTKG